jgi:hypothetical protein
VSNQEREISNSNFQKPFAGFCLPVRFFKYSFALRVEGRKDAGRFGLGAEARFI